MSAQPVSARDLGVEPEAETYRLHQLVDLVRAGRMRLPHFQRELKWGKEDVVALFDSIFRGFPIGSLLLWERPASAASVALGEVQIDAPDIASALWVVDGQQRITALLNSLDPVAGLQGAFALVYDLRSRRVRAAKGNERESIPLTSLFELPSLLAWTGEHPEYADRINEMSQLTTRLRDFRVPAYVVRSTDERVLREIFDRMNNSGKRLKRAEIFSALTAPGESAHGEPNLQTLRDHIDDDLRWGVVDDDTILRMFLARRGHDVTREIRLEAFDDADASRNEFAGESRAEAYRGAQQAIDRSVRFLRDDLGVPHFSFLPYRYLLVVLTRYFAHFPDPHPRNRELMKRWFWRAALVGPAITPGNITGAMRYLGAEIRPDDECGSTTRLLEQLDGKPYLTNVDATRFRANTAATRVLLCVLWSLQPRSPETGEPFTAEDLADDIGSASSANRAAQELVRRSILSKRSLRGSAGNRLLLPGVPIEAFDGLLSSLSSEQSGGASRVLASHLVPTGRAGLTVDALVAGRTEKLTAAVADFVKGMTGEGLDDTPPLASLDLDDEDELDGRDDVDEDVG